MQGRFKPGLLLLPIATARLRGARVAISPHNLFERGGGRASALSLLCELRISNSVVVFSERDRERAARLGTSSIVSPLVMHLPDRSTEGPIAWRERWGAGDGQRIVLFAGQIRADKRLDILIRAVAELPRSRWRLAVVGEDKGVAAEMRALAGKLGVEASWHVEYCEAAEFAAALEAADVIACPYERGSQSAVLAMAHQLGVTTVARDVGGLAELATVSVSTADPADLAAACELAVDVPSPDPGAWCEAALDSHLRAYEFESSLRGSMPQSQ